MTYRKTAATGLCLAVICVAPVLWSAYKERTIQRKLAESGRQCRVRAERGDTDAQYRLGSAYYYGKGVPQDYAEAIRWYRKSANQGIAKAQYALGYCYFHGQGVPQDNAEAVRWLRIAADQGYSTAQRQLASMYYRGTGVPQDYAEALLRYRSAAEQGDAGAQWYLGRAYGSGLGVTRDSVEAARWRLKVFGQAVIHCTRRVGWKPWVSIALFLASFMVSRHDEWLKCALIAGGGATGALNVLSGTWCYGWGHVPFFAFLTMVAVAYTYAAVMIAVRGRGPGVDPGQRPATP